MDGMLPGALMHELNLGWQHEFTWASGAIVLTVLAVQFWRRVSSPWGLAGLFVIFPITMLGGNFGLGWPIIITLHLSEAECSTTALVWVGTPLSIGLFTLAGYGASKFLPEPLPGKTVAASGRYAPSRSAVMA